MCIEITCASVPNVENGMMEFSSPSLPNGNFPYDTEVLYRCNNDFSLQGVTVRRCSGNGNSTVGMFDNVAPECNLGTYVTLCVYSYCIHSCVYNSV